jgi:hypothetical protein
MLPKSKKEAIEQGVKVYYTGNLCKRGGLAFRRLNGDCLCSDCQDFYNEIKRQWAVNNKHIHAEWRKNNPDKMAKYQSEWTKRNKEQSKQAIKLWKSTNKDAVDASTAKRRASKLQATASWYGELDELVMVEAFDLARLRYRTTGIKWHIDHMIPLQAKEASGIHCASNIQVIPEKLNVSKANKMFLTEPNQWIKYL